MEPATGPAAATAPNQKHQSLDRAQRAASNRTVGPLFLLLHSQHVGVLVLLVLLLSSRCVSCSHPAKVHRGEARRRLRVRLGLRQLVGEREGQQGELGQLEQHQQRGGRQRRWGPHAPLHTPLHTPLHYLIKKK